MISSTYQSTTTTLSSTLSSTDKLFRAMGSLISARESRKEYKTDQVIGIKHAPFALTDIWSWGRNGHGQLGTSDRTGMVNYIKRELCH